MNVGDYILGYSFTNEYEYVALIKSIDYHAPFEMLIELEILSVNGESLQKTMTAMITEREAMYYTRTISKEDLPKICGDLL